MGVAEPGVPVDGGHGLQGEGATETRTSDRQRLSGALEMMVTTVPGEAGRRWYPESPPAAPGPPAPTPGRLLGSVSNSIWLISFSNGSDTCRVDGPQRDKPSPGRVWILG